VTSATVVDNAKLPNGLRVQTVWAPETTTDPEDRPIALVRDSKRFWISAIPMLIAFVVGSAIALLTTQRLLLIPVAAVLALSYQYGLRGRTGYDEVSADGSLGEFLGLKTPLGLSAMRRAKA
jgi:hypothetical protein